MTTRFQKAKLIAKMGLCKIVQRDAKGRARHVIVPGTEAKQYNVYLSRQNGSIHAECELITGNGAVGCRGNHVTFCTHALSAILASAEGFESAVCSTVKKAALVARLHARARVTPLVSKGANKVFYLVTWR